MAAHETDLFHRNIVIGLNFAGHETAQRSGAVLERIEYFPVERDMRRVVIIGVLDQNEPVVRA